MPERRAPNPIRSAAVSAFRIPTEQPEESDGTATWNATTLVVVELHSGNTAGLGFTYSDVTAAHLAQELIRKEVLGKDAFAIPEIHSALDREVRNMGRPGLVSTAISAIDTCLWDLKARLMDCPLVEFNPNVIETANRYLAEPLRMEAARYLLPEGDGLGVEIVNI